MITLISIPFLENISNEIAKLPQIPIKYSVHPDIPEIGGKPPFNLKIERRYWVNNPNYQLERSLQMYQVRQSECPSEKGMIAYGFSRVSSLYCISRQITSCDVSFAW